MLLSTTLSPTVCSPPDDSIAPLPFLAHFLHLIIPSWNRGFSVNLFPVLHIYILPLSTALLLRLSHVLECALVVYTIHLPLALACIPLLFSIPQTYNM